MTRSHQLGLVSEIQTLYFLGGWHFIGRFLSKGEKKLNAFLWHKDLCCCVGFSWVLSSVVCFFPKNWLSNPTTELSDLECFQALLQALTMVGTGGAVLSPPP